MFLAGPAKISIVFVVNGSVTQKIGKVFTAQLRHDGILAREMLPDGTVPLGRLFDILGRGVNPSQQFADGRLLAAFLQRNDKQRFFVNLVLREN